MLSSTSKSLKFKQDLLPSAVTLLFKNCSEFFFRIFFAIRFPYQRSKLGGSAGRSTQNATRGTIFLRIADWLFVPEAAKATLRICLRHCFRSTRWRSRFFVIG